MVQIAINFQFDGDAQELFAQVSEIIAKGIAANPQMDAAKTAKAAPAAKKAAAKKAEAKPENSEPAVPEAAILGVTEPEQAEEKKITLAEIRPLALKMMEAGRKAELVELLAAHGAKQLKQLPETEYAAFHHELTEVLA